MKILSTINIDTLILPISVDSPAGTDPRLDTSSTSLYYQIKDARNYARALERQRSQGFDTAEVKGEWEKVQKLALTIFSSIGKDIEVTAWFIEAQVRLFQFSGFSDSLLFLRKLCESYWDNLFPSLDEEGLASRIAIITGLNGSDNDGVLIPPLVNLKITESQTTDSFALWQYEQAVDVNMISDPAKKQKKLDEGAVAYAIVEASALATPLSFFRETAVEIETCLSELLLLNQILEAKCGYEAPSLSRIKNTLSNCYDAIKILGKSAFDIPITQSPSVLTDMTNSHDEPITKYHLKDREKAFSAILEIASFFQESEPHSPLSFILKKAVRWGRMSLPSLLAELIKEDSVLKQFYTLAGIEEEKNAS